MPASFKYDVFLSHNSLDKPQVRRLAERLKSEGVRVWFDEWAVQAGDIISLKVDEGLEHARVLLLCISPTALASEWVALEKSTAIHRDPTNAGRRFIPLLLADCPLPATLRRYKILDFREESDFAFAEVLEACRMEAAAIEEIRALLSNAGAEANSKRALKQLMQAKELAEKLSEEMGANGKLIQAEVFAACAIEDSRPRMRSDWWRRCLKACQAAWKQGLSIRAADCAAIYAVDCFQDTLSDLEQDEKQKLLARAKDLIDEALSLPNTEHTKATLLIRKSSVMRHQSISQLSKSQKQKILGECVRCTELARKLSPDFGVLVEAGQAAWISARFEDDDAKYAFHLREAERLLMEPATSGDSLARLTLARFYRLNFDPLSACEMFPRELTSTSKLRHRLRDSYVFGEAVIQLWYQEYPDVILRPLLIEAKLFLETALSAGYNIARIAISLAFVTALLDGQREGEGVLAEMFGDSSANPWNRASAIASQSSTGTPLEAGLALGIDQSEIWQSLGTYARRILKMNVLAEQFYRRALALNDRNAVALTNLARVLIERSAYPEARRYLDKAKTFSDRRFFWWKTVLAELNSREYGAISKPPLAESSAPTRLTKPLQSLLEVYRRYKLLRNIDGCHEHGKLLEELFVELARLNYNFTSHQYQTKELEGTGFDASFERRGVNVFVQCIWSNCAATKDQILAFTERLKNTNGHGLFASMSGFVNEAVEKAREVCKQQSFILLDGNEVDLIFSGRVRLDAVIAKKMCHMMHESEPFSPISAEHFG